ncbi:MAG: cysteine desulfurase family protein [Caulobacteraceae bacterium]
MSEAIYLDYNATAKTRPEAVQAVADALASWANPSSVHAAGRLARAAVEAARADVAVLVGATADQVTFVSGGAEANAQVILGAREAGAGRVIIGATEHETVTENAAACGLPVEAWPVDSAGRAELGWLEDHLAAAPRALVCLMLANNETGVIQPVAEAAAIVRDAGGWLHVDAVQAAGKIAVEIAALGADTLALSAHKLGGPPGIGALIAGPRARVHPLIRGGGQEGGLRSGTLNAPGVAGFAAAARSASRDLPALTSQIAWRSLLESKIEEAGAIVLGKSAPRLPQTLCFSTPDFGSDVQVMAMDLAGVMISAGAACSSGRVKASRVAAAMGRPELAPFAVRISGGWASGEDDWNRCGEAWLAAFARHDGRRNAPLGRAA